MRLGRHLTGGESRYNAGLKNIGSATCFIFHLPIIDYLDERGGFFELRIAEFASAVTRWICCVCP
jgi:hypothetical protein